MNISDDHRSGCKASEALNSKYEENPSGGRFLCTITNYSPHLSLIYISTKPLEENNKGFDVNLNKNFGYKHFHLLDDSKLLFKVLSKRDGHSMVFNGSHKRYLTIHTHHYFCTIWNLIEGEWVVHTLNKFCNWKDDVNILCR